MPRVAVVLLLATGNGLLLLLGATTALCAAMVVTTEGLLEIGLDRLLVRSPVASTCLGCHLCFGRG